MTLFFADLSQSELEKILSQNFSSSTHNKNRRRQHKNNNDINENVKEFKSKDNLNKTIYLLEVNSNITELIDEKLLTNDEINGNNFIDKFGQKIIESGNIENINLYTKNTQEDKKENYCAKDISNKEMDEEQCLNGLNSSNNNSNNKKCCFIEVIQEVNDKPIWKNCLPISEANLKDNKYLESLIPKFNEPTLTRIKCNNYYYIRRIPASEMSQCESVVNPSSQEQCNNIMFLNKLKLKNEKINKKTKTKRENIFFSRGCHIKNNKKSSYNMANKQL
mgnify:CR=1 FL=1